MLEGRFQNNDFVTSASYVPDTGESPKTHKRSWRAPRRRQRSIDGSQDGFVENPVRVISVAVLILVQVYVFFIKKNAIWKYFGNINSFGPSCLKSCIRIKMNR